MKRLVPVKGMYSPGAAVTYIGPGTQVAHGSRGHVVSCYEDGLVEARFSCGTTLVTASVNLVAAPALDWWRGQMH